MPVHSYAVYISSILAMNDYQHAAWAVDIAHLSLQ